MNGFMGSHWGIFPGFGGILGWIIIILIVVIILYNFSGHQKPHEDDPLTLLKNRLVKGEISKEEFEELKKIITK